MITLLQHMLQASRFLYATERFMSGSHPVLPLHGGGDSPLGAMLPYHGISVPPLTLPLRPPITEA